MPELKHGEIIFNGISSRDFGLVVEEIPTFTKPRQKVHVLDAPGLNGSTVMKEAAWENVEVSYSVWFSHARPSAVEGLSFSELVERITAWLYTPMRKATYVKSETLQFPLPLTPSSYKSFDVCTAGTGEYCKLTDSFHPFLPGYYRLAYFAGPIDFVDELLETGRTTITFSCQPQLFYAAGDVWWGQAYWKVGTTVRYPLVQSNSPSYPPLPEIMLVTSIDTTAAINDKRIIQFSVKSKQHVSDLAETTYTVRLEIPNWKFATLAIAVSSQLKRVLAFEQLGASVTPKLIGLDQYATFTPAYTYPSAKVGSSLMDVVLEQADHACTPDPTQGDYASAIPMAFKAHNWTL